MHPSRGGLPKMDHQNEFSILHQNNANLLNAEVRKCLDNSSLIDL